MNEKKSKKEKYVVVSASSSYSAIQNLPNQIDALNRIYLQFDYDNNKSAQASLSQLYVISLCMFVEAFLRSAYSTYINRNFNNTTDDQLRHLINELEKRINKLTWQTLQDSAIIYLERRIPDSITNSNYYKTVNKMFELRNLMVHGNNFELEFLSGDTELDYRIAGNANTIYQYLIERNVFNSSEILDTTHFHLNRESICLFINDTLEFADIFSNFISKELQFNGFKDLEIFKIMEMKDNIKICKK